MDQDELYLLQCKSRQQVSRQGTLSVQSTKNLLKVVQTLRGMNQIREVVLTFWKRCLDLSPSAFMLASSTVTPYPLLHA